MQQASAQRDVEDERMQYINAENARQNAFRQKAREAYDPALAGQGVDKQKEKLSEEAADLEQKYSRNVKAFDPATSYLPGQGKSEVVAGAVQRGQNTAAAGALDEAKRRAALDAYIDLNLRNKVDLERSSQEIDMFGNFAQGSSGVVPLELAAANHAGDGKMRLGQILSGLGQAAGTAAAFGAGPSWGDVGDWFGFGGGSIADPMKLVAAKAPAMKPFSGIAVPGMDPRGLIA